MEGAAALSREATSTAQGGGRASVQLRWTRASGGPGAPVSPGPPARMPGAQPPWRSEVPMTAFAPAFLATVLVASITPGPSMLLALDHGVRHGPRRAVSTALGNVAATALQCVVSLAGLGVVLARSAWFFTTLRHVGAAYLVYCGLKMILAGVGDLEAAPGAPRAGRPLGLFTQAFLVTLGNPKAIFFFSALFPQFIDERALTASRASFMLTSV